MTDFTPFFVRVLGLADDPKGPNPYADIDDPTAHPMMIVCFGLDGYVVSGYYLPEMDEFFELIDDDDGNSGTTHHVPKSDPKHKACLQTIDKFADHLIDGGTPNMEKVRIPSCYQNRRHSSRTQPSSPPSTQTVPS